MEEFAKRYPDVVIAPAQFAAGRFLEKSGQRFLVDFGYENAEAKALNILESFDDNVIQ